VSLPRRLLWSFSGLFALVVAWAAGHAAYGPFVLPRPDEALAAVVGLLRSGEAGAAILVTAEQALLGWAIGLAIGFAVALPAGFVEPLALAARPVATLLVAMPPVAWIVLALLWFGPCGGADAFTVAVTVAPILFGAALQGVASRDPALDEMAAQFRAPPLMRFSDVVAPQLFAHLAPAAGAALGFAWKVCVMAEVIASGAGIGGQLAIARAHLDLPLTFAWLIVIVALALASDAVLIWPLRRRTAVA
jgi:NitT/TauT family transport system permease protein